MELLYAKEHLTCFNYAVDERPEVLSMDLSPEEPYVFRTIGPEILMALDGHIAISFEKIDNGMMTTGEMSVLPACSRVVVTAEEPAKIMIFRLGTDIRLCDRYSFEKLYEDTGYAPAKFEGRLNTVKANARVAHFIKGLMDAINDGLRCVYYFEIKIRELFFLFRTYYPKEELAAFFNSLLSADSDFLRFVTYNYSKVHSVKEFAQLAGYSLSGFDKQFRKVFGVSAYQWMKQKRLKGIYHEINCSPKTLREICDGQGFSSLSQFNDYCKKNFGMPPGKIRRQSVYMPEKDRE